MLNLRAKLLTAITTAQHQTAERIPLPLRQLVRRFSGGDQWTAQVIRGWLWQYRYFVLLALGANIGAALFEGGTMGVFTLALDTLAGSPQTGVTAAVGGLTTFIQQWQGKVGNTTAFFLLLGLAAFMQISRSLLEFSGQAATAYLRSWLEGDSKRRIFHQFLNMSYPLISSYRTGDLISYTQQVTNVGNLITNTNYIMIHLLIVVAYAVVLIWLSWQMTVGALIALALLSIALGFLRVKIRRISGRFLTASVLFNERIVEFLQGLRVIHTFGRQDYAAASVDAVVNDSIRAQRQGAIWSMSVMPIMQSITVLGVVVFLMFGYQIIQRTGTSAIPRLATFIFILYRLLPRIGGLNGALALINNDFPFVERVAAILRPDDKLYVQSGKQPFTGLQRAIRFMDVTLQYPNSNQNAVSHLSFTIERSQMTAFVGASGAGKSTLVNLLLRLYDPTCGQLLADGINLPRPESEPLAQSCGYRRSRNFYLQFNHRR